DIRVDFSSDCNMQSQLTVKFDVAAVKLPSQAAADKPINVTVENVELTADDLKKMNLQANDTALSISALDLATAGAQPITVSLPAKARITLSAKPIVEGNYKLQLTVSFRGAQCLKTGVLSGPPRTPIRLKLKAASPATCELIL